MREFSLHIESKKNVMNNFACFSKTTMQYLCSCCSFLIKLSNLSKSIRFLVLCCYRFLYLRANPFIIQLFYFLSLSSLGFLVLIALNPRTDSFRPSNLDFFFTSVSAATVSSMSTVEMEAFSNSQLIVLTVLMFIGGEVFTSMVGLFLRQFKLKQTGNRVVSVSNLIEQIETGLVLDDLDPAESANNLNLETKVLENPIEDILDRKLLMYHSIKYLGFVVLSYLLVVHVLGVAMVSIYLALVSSARNVLKNKGLKTMTFSIFTTVSTFASCGFVPTNENMIVFSKNSGLLLMLIPQVLMGNTLFPSCLRFSIWVLGKLNIRKEESKFLLKNSAGIGYLHLLPSLHSSILVGSVFGFILIQFVLFCSMEWNSEALSGLSSYEKLIGSLFQTVNTRHTGETIVDLSIISPAILVVFIVMMYLPPYTSFLPIKENEKNAEKSERRRKKRGKVMDNLIFSQLSYLVVFIILVCITERKRLKEDPLNFNALNIALEVISAYGNVGFTTGYNCKRQLNPNSDCKDKWFGFSGRWSAEGKIILIVVMVFGRLKKFNMNGGRAWILL